MPKDSFEVQISFRRLLIGLLLTVVPISIAGLWGVAESDRSLEKAIGGHFQTHAENTAASLARFIDERAVEVGMLAADAAVVEAAQNASSSYKDQSDEAVSNRIQQIENIWATPASDKIVQQVLTSPASRSLRRHIQNDPRLLRVTVTDAKGATIAATHKTLDYYQADEEYWQDIYAQGHGAINITDVLHDDVTQRNYIGVGAPILDEAGQVIGTLDTLVEVSSLFPVVQQARVGESGRALLVRHDGTIISAPNVTLSMRQKAPEFIAVRAVRTDLLDRPPGYLVTDVSGSGRNLVAYADTGLKERYSKLGWMVMVAQTAREALAPSRFASLLIAFMSLLGLAMVTLLIVYFVLHRKVKLLDISDTGEEEHKEVPDTAVQRPRV